ncbi:hypothetical protein R5R35_005384 [Gryllus longicercus]|uniref:Uncharacterized protein n=1 Tax=Gryllus longicercus TaxID=2509291 RepID=A0AAN9V620_9ORTH
MGSAPQVRAAAGAVLSVTVVSLALGTTLVALLLAPVVRAAQSGETDPSSREDGDDPGSPDEDCCLLDREICNEPCRFPNDICGCCAPSHEVNKPPPRCHRGPPDNAFYLVAQIALGAALVVAITALVSIVLRTCNGRRRSEERPQFRPASASATSLDVYVRDRLHDCPPSYDEISWEKPPSYANLPVIEGAAEAPDRREIPSSAPSVSDTSEPAGAASPPAYPGIVFTISQHVEQAPLPPPRAEAGAALGGGAAACTEESSKDAAPAAAAQKPTTDA